MCQPVGFVYAGIGAREKITSERDGEKWVNENFNFKLTEDKIRAFPVEVANCPITEDLSK